MRYPFLIASPRTGSSQIYRILLEYLRVNEGIVGLGEYFLGYHPTFDTGGGIGTLPTGPACSLLSAAERDRIAAEKWELLQKYPGRYFFKLSPEHVPLSIAEDLCRNYRPIFLERRNLWDQYLSLAISFASGIWSENQGARSFDKLEFIDCAPFLEQILLTYREIKGRVPDPEVIIYEDAARDLDWKSLLKKLGMDQNLEGCQLVLGKKQNPDSAGKLRRFRDPDAVIRAYCNSRLNELDPCLNETGSTGRT